MSLISSLGRAALSLLLAFDLAACSSEGGFTNGNAGSGAAGNVSGTGGACTGVACAHPDCASNADCASGSLCDTASGACVSSDACGESEIGASYQRSKLLIVLDRSCSMTSKVNGTEKWTLAVNAVKNVIGQFSNRVDFGLELFPDKAGDKCEQDAPMVPIAASSAGAIIDLLEKALDPADVNYPSGPCVTDIDSAMVSAAGELWAAEKPSFSLLITDGKQFGCEAEGGNAGTLATLQKLAAGGVRTFVVGFGSVDKIDVGEMNLFADAGGAPKNDPAERYYLAESGDALDQALEKISSQVVGCTYQLDSVPPDPSKLYVFLDGQSVNRDPSDLNGWDFDSTTNSVSFYGAVCEKLQTGAVSEVQVSYGCPVAVPH